jgi:hypothetical protein
MGPLISIERDEPLKGPQLPLDLGRTELTSIELVTENPVISGIIKDKKRIQ